MIARPKSECFLQSSAGLETFGKALYNQFSILKALIFIRTLKDRVQQMLYKFHVYNFYISNSEQDLIMIT